MTRDLADRLELYAAEPVKVERLALNFDQVEQYGPPPNPAKVTDSRYGKYVEIHGDESWELDAMSPEILAGLVRDHVERYRDEEAWGRSQDRQASARETLSRLADEWED